MQQSSFSRKLISFCLLWALIFIPGLTQPALAQDPGDTALRITLDNAPNLSELTTIKAHPTAINSMTFSPDGSLLATAGQDRVLRVWDSASLEMVAEMTGHEDQIFDLAFHPNGTQIVTVSRDRTVRVWDIATGEALHILPDHDREVVAVAYSPDGNLIASSGLDELVRIWNAETGEQVTALEGINRDSTNYAIGLNFGPESNTLITGLGKINFGQVYDTSGERLVEVWDIESGEKLLEMSGHTDTVYEVMYSPTGEVIASASKDMTVRLWDAATGEALHVLTGHEDEVRRSIGFSPDGALVASASYDKTLRLWNVETGEAVISLETPSIVQSMAFSPAGDHIATGGLLGRVTLWGINGESEATTQADSAQLVAIHADNAFQVRPLATLEGHQTSVAQLMFSRDGQKLLSASHDNTARVWDVATGETILTLDTHTDRVYQARFSPDETLIATASRDKTIRIYDAATGEEHHVLEGHTDRAVAANFSPDGQYLISSSDDQSVRVWDVASGEAVHVFEDIGEGHNNFPVNVEYSPDGTRFLTANGNLWNATDTTGYPVALWDATTGEPLMNFGRYERAFFTVTFGPDGNYIYATGKDQLVRIWDVASGEEVLTLSGHESELRNSVAFSPDGSLIATGSMDNTLRFWSAETGDELAMVESDGDFIQSLAFSPTGTLLATGNLDGSIVLWGADEGISRFETVTLDNAGQLRVSQEIAAHQNNVVSLAFAPSGDRIASAGYDNMAYVWDAASGEQVTALEGHTERLYDIAFSPDGSLIATASRDRTVNLWDAASGELLHTLAGHEGEVLAVVFLPEGQLVSGSADGTLRVWDVETGEVLNVYTDMGLGLEKYPLTLAVHPDGSLIATGLGNIGGVYADASEELPVRLWALPDAETPIALDGHTSAIWQVQFNVDGSRLVSGSKDTTAIVWDVETGEALHTLAGHESDIRRGVVFSPDGSLIATASHDRTLRVWNADSGELVTVLPKTSAFIESLAFHPDGYMLATGDLNGGIQVWTVDLSAEQLGVPTETDEADTAQDTASDASDDPAEPTITDVDLGMLTLDQTLTGAVSRNERRIISFQAAADQPLVIDNNSFFVQLDVINAETGDVLVEASEEMSIGPLTFPVDGTYQIIITPTSMSGNYSIRIREPRE